MKAKAKGIDVSVFQGNIDWKKVASSGVKFAFIRGGYGRSGIDEKFEVNYKNAVKAGLPVGVYHYSYATSVERAREEADFCLSYLKGKKFEYPVAFDIEDKTQLSLSKKLLTDIVYEFCSRVEKAGCYVCIYSSKSFLLDKLDMSRLSKFDVWVAQWNDKCTYTGNYGLWQYSDKGEVDGIKGNVDLDKAYKDYPSIIKSAGLNGFTKAAATKPSNEPEKPKAKEKPKTTAKTYKQYDAIKLSNTPLYTASTATSTKLRKTGTFYIYDGEVINGKMRITRAKSLCGKKPVWLHVTGWIVPSDLK